MEKMILKGIHENNLKNISLEISKNKIVVFTGISGSGKSSLVFDTIAVESQRELYELLPRFVRNKLPSYEKPKSELIENLSPAVIIDQKPIQGNSRSTVGTLTEINPLIRLLFSRIGKPSIGPASVYSFNHPKGMCLECSGLGKVFDLDQNKFFDLNRSLSEGAIRFSPFNIGSWQLKIYTQAPFLDSNKALKDFSQEEWDKFLYGIGIEKGYKVYSGSEWLSYDGIISRFKRLWLNRDITKLNPKLQKEIKELLTESICPSCQGQRLNKKVLSSKINGHSISYFLDLEIKELIEELLKLEDEIGLTLGRQIISILTRIKEVGLEYLTLSRSSTTLSGGEGQRLKLVRHLGSSLNGMTYILDEPSAGLHAQDIERLMQLIIHLKEKGNSVLIVEHNREVISKADEIIDMGPLAGSEGGKIVYQGDYSGLLKSQTTTGELLRQPIIIKEEPRPAQGYYKIDSPGILNLSKLSLQVPKNVLTIISGVAGAGKSTLLTKVFLKKYPDSIIINQKTIVGSSRSTPATYTGIMDTIRDVFARENNVPKGMFSFNSIGACEYCKGKGKIIPDMVFADPITIICEVCEGKRYSKEALSYLYQGKNISDVLDLTISDAYEFFNLEKIKKNISVLKDVGLGYLTLGQPISTLSGGEKQRIKISSEIGKKGNIYLLDEPTTGLHLHDIEKLIELIDKLIDNGNTVIIAEHNLDMIAQGDWIIDLGPGGGKNGGKILFEGIPECLIQSESSITGMYLKRRIKEF